MTEKITRIVASKKAAKSAAHALRRGNIISGYAGREVTAYVPHTMTAEQVNALLDRFAR